MKYRFTGEQDEITLRGVTFKKGKAVDVEDPALAQKLDALGLFEVVKPRADAK